MKRPSIFLVFVFLFSCVSDPLSANVTAQDGRIRSRDIEKAQPFLGTFLGSINTALTPTPHDDLNHNPCGYGDDPSCRDRNGDFSAHLNPLVNVVVKLDMDDAGVVSVSVFGDRESYEKDESIDLMGKYCQSSIDELLAYDYLKSETGLEVFEFYFKFNGGNCPARLRLSAGHPIIIRVERTTGEELATNLEFSLYRNTIERNYIYAVYDDGREEKVKVNQNAEVFGSMYNPIYQYCPVDEHGNIITDQTRCFRQSREVKGFALPIGFGPDGVGLGVTAAWHTVKSPKIKLKKMPPVELYHQGQFRRYDVE